MVFVLFWCKVLGKRIIELIKISPVAIIGGGIFMGALAYTRTNIVITLNRHTCIPAAALLFFIIFALSLKKHPVLEKLTFYSKSGYTNTLLRHIFYLKRAVANNGLSILFLGCVFTKRIVFDFSMPIGNILLLFLTCLLFSFIVIIINNRNSRSRAKPVLIPIHPRIKSTLYDYENAAVMGIIIIAVSLFIGIELLKNPAMLKRMEQPLFIPLLLFTVLSIGLCGIFDAIPHTNWLFYSIVSLDFKDHVKRSMVFLVSFYGIILLQYAVITAYIDIKVWPIYMAGIIITVSLAVSMAFCSGGMVKKTVIYLLFIRIALSLLYANPYIMLAALPPVILLFFKAKSEYRDWTYL
jgi:hypothetical protein